MSEFDLELLAAKMRRGCGNMSDDMLRLALKNRRNQLALMEGMPEVIVNRQKVMVEETEREFERRGL